MVPVRSHGTSGIPVIFIPCTLVLGTNVILWQTMLNFMEVFLNMPNFTKKNSCGHFPKIHWSLEKLL